MNKLKIILVTLVVAVGILATGNTANAEIDWSWTNPAINNAFVKCPATASKACLKSLTLTDTTLTPVVISSTIDPTATSYVQTTGIAFGARTFALTLQYVDENGTAQSLAADPTAITTLEVHFLPLAPTALSGTQK